jgi:non-specific serine/threonine protein kinase
MLALLRGEPDVARRLFEEGVAAARAVAHRSAEGMNLWGLAQLSASQPDFAGARRFAEAALAAFNNAGWQRGVISILGFLGDLNFWEGDYAAARPLLERSLALAHGLGADWWSASTLTRLGQVAMETGDLRQAALLVIEGLDSSQRLSDRNGLALGLLASAQLAAACGEFKRGLRLAGAADHLGGGRLIGGPLRAQASVREALERRVSSMRTALGERAAADTWAEGQAMGWVAALDEAMSTCRSVAVTKARTGTAAVLTLGLSQRQMQVLQLVAEGKSNREIADELVLSQKTVKRHVENVFDKLGVTSRVAATAVALRAGVA